MPGNFAIMFAVEDGGVSNPVQWSKDNLKSDNIIMIVDELNGKLWLWHGKLRGLVSRRTAMRQAQSLKGHGYTIGRSIIGRNLTEIVEIEERKIGRVPEVTALNDQFMEVLNMSFKEEGNFVVSLGEGDGSSSSSSSAPKPTPAKPEPKPEPKPAAPAPKPELKPEPKPVVASEPNFNGSEYDESSVDVPEPAPAPTPTPSKSTSSSNDVKLGIVIISIMSQFKDIWASKKEDGSISIEQMDGPVCQFSIEGGNVKFTPGSFKDIDPSIKQAIQNKFTELSSGL